MKKDDPRDGQWESKDFGRRVAESSNLHNVKANPCLLTTTCSSSLTAYTTAQYRPPLRTAPLLPRISSAKNYNNPLSLALSRCHCYPPSRAINCAYYQHVSRFLFLAIRFHHDRRRGGLGGLRQGRLPSRQNRRCVFRWPVCSRQKARLGAFFNCLARARH